MNINERLRIAEKQRLKDNEKPKLEKKSNHYRPITTYNNLTAGKRPGEFVTASDNRKYVIHRDGSLRRLN